MRKNPKNFPLEITDSDETFIRAEIHNFKELNGLAVYSKGLLARAVRKDFHGLLERVSG